MKFTFGRAIMYNEYALLEINKVRSIKGAGGALQLMSKFSYLQSQKKTFSIPPRGGGLIST